MDIYNGPPIPFYIEDIEEILEWSFYKFVMRVRLDTDSLKRIYRIDFVYKEDIDHYKLIWNIISNE